MTLADFIALMQLIDDKTVVNGVPLEQLKQAVNVLRNPLPIAILSKKK